MSSSFNPATKLDQLLDLPAENEVVEFKEAKSGYDFRKLGKYFSALCNEANLQRQDFAWLIFGVANNRSVVGSQFRPNRPDLDSLKEEIGNKTTSRVTLTEIHEVMRDGKRVVMLEVPPAPRATLVAFEGHFYARDGESLQALNPVEYERIRAQSLASDWSAVTVPSATLADLDPAALLQARTNYVAKFADQQAEVETWDDEKFLSKAKMTIEGELTRAAILLLDRVQKGQPIDDIEAKRLRSRKLIEGRKPNYYVAKAIADLTDKKAEYTKNRALDKQYYLDMICAAIDEHGFVSRKDLDELLWNKLTELMNDHQKKRKIGNLLSELSRAGRIENGKVDGVSIWGLSNPDVEPPV